MKATTKTNALNKLLRIEETKKASARAKSWAMNGIEIRSTAPEEVAKRAVDAHAAQCNEYEADKDFRALPKPRRDWGQPCGVGLGASDEHLRSGEGCV